jgi:hypothetical protein
MTVARLFMVLSTRIAVPAKKSRRLIAMISYPMQADQENAHALTKFQLDPLIRHQAHIRNGRVIATHGVAASNPWRSRQEFAAKLNLKCSLAEIGCWSKRLLAAPDKRHWRSQPSTFIEFR